MDDCYRSPRRIKHGAVHLWQAQVPMESRAAGSLSHLLSPDEDLRARRFGFARDRDAFIFFRGLLRLLLSSYLELAPNKIRFLYGPYGKPALAPECGRLEFNLSHSNGFGVIAFSPDQEVGVDIEFVSEGLADWQVAHQYFSPHEIGSLQNVPAELFPEAFFSCWTRKEAYVKARGLGLSLALDQFDVSVAPGERAALLGSRENPQQMGRWTFKDLNLRPRFKGALAVKGPDLKFEVFRWSDDCDVTQLADAVADLGHDGWGRSAFAVGAGNPSKTC